MHGNIGYTQIRTGANGCGWVCMGALGHGGHGEHKNKASGVHLGSCRSGFKRYGRGNFPEHDVLWVLPKMLKNECGLVQIGSDGYNKVYSHGEKKKNMYDFKTRLDYKTYQP